MKIFFLATLLASAAAFTPSSSRLTASRKAVTSMNLIPDPEFLHHLSSNCADALRVVVMECDNQECAEATVYKQGDGWQFTGGLEGEARATSKKILMMVMDDCE